MIVMKTSGFIGQDPRPRMRTPCVTTSLHLALLSIAASVAEHTRAGYREAAIFRRLIDWGHAREVVP